MRRLKASAETADEAAAPRVPGFQAFWMRTHSKECLFHPNADTYTFKMETEFFKITHAFTMWEALRDSILFLSFI